MDLTLKLPDEVLCHVFSYVTSIIHRFRSAAENQKFRRCVFKEFKKPLPLVIEMAGGRLCGHKLPRANWPTALEVLAKEASFKSIESREVSSINSIEVLFRIVCNTDSLSQLNSIIYGGPTDRLESLIRNCPKLSVLCLKSTWSTRHSYVRFPNLDLPSLLETKAITHLELDLYQYTQQEFIEILSAIKPGVLKILSIHMNHSSSSDFGPAFRELTCMAGASLEVLNFELWDSNLSHQPHNELHVFQSVAHFPSLRYWVALGFFLSRSDQLARALVSLLSNSDRRHDLLVSFTDGFTNGQLPLCQVIEQIRKVERTYPALVFGFTTESTGWIELKLGKITLLLCASAREICDTTCLCVCCYSNVYQLLVFKSRNMAESDSRLENRWLDRCKVGSIAQVINDNDCGQTDKKKVLHVEENDAGDLATITFKGQQVEQFKITVCTRRCFDKSCTKCLGLV